MPIPPSPPSRAVTPITHMRLAAVLGCAPASRAEEDDVVAALRDIVLGCVDKASSTQNGIDALLQDAGCPNLTLASILERPFAAARYAGDKRLLVEAIADVFKPVTHNALNETSYAAHSQSYAPSQPAMLPSPRTAIAQVQRLRELAALPLDADACHETVRAAQRMVRRGDYEPAERLLRQAALHAPEHPALNHWLGVLLSRYLLRPVEGERFLQRAVDAQPRNPAYMFALGMAEMLLFSPKAAATFARTHNLMPTTEHEDRDALCLALARSTTQPVASHNFSRAAERGFRVKLKQDPSNAEFLAGLGLALWQQKRDLEARAFLKVAQACAPSRADFAFEYARMTDEVGKLCTIADAWPRVPYFSAALVFLPDAAQNLERTEHFARQALDVAGNNPRLHEALSTVLFHRGKHAEAARRKILGQVASWSALEASDGMDTAF